VSGVIRAGIQLLAGACLGLAILAAALAAPARAASPDIDALRRASLALVNNDRRAHHLPPLAFDDTLNRIAQAHAEDMLAKGYFNHVSPSGRTPMRRFLSAGGSKSLVLRENIFHCVGCPQPADAQGVADLESGWMHSPPHRANILAKGITRYGFGLAENPAGGRYAVQDFDGPGVSQGEATGGKPIAPEQVTGLAASIINGMRSGAKVVDDTALAQAARTSIPGGRFANASLAAIDPLAHLAPGAPWHRYRMLMGGCGGCGTDVTGDDVRSFVERWAKNPRDREMLVDPAFIGFGMAVAADGNGGKIAVAVLAAD
jgi:uncharacterized protein YkwD